MLAQVILADPPWTWKAYSERGEGRSAKNHYRTMTLDGIKELAPFVAERAAKDCALFLWAIDPMLPQALEVMRAWGFTFKTVAFTWVKLTLGGNPSTGLGYWTRANPEMCLLGTKGRPIRISKAVRQLVVAPRGVHSAKPPEVRQRIELLLDGPYLELFAREQVTGWDAWGEEI